MNKWQLDLKNAVTDYTKLCSILNLDPTSIKIDPNTKFPLLATKSFINRIQPNNPNDPLLLQILPSTQETITDRNYSDDPLQESHFNKIPGLLHKYNGRVLVIGSYRQILCTA